MKEDKSRERMLQRRARERAEDRAAGRPQRGLLTGRGRQLRDEDEDEDPTLEDDALEIDAELDDYDDEFQEPRPRVGAKRTVLNAIRQVPAYIRLMFSLMRDSRVSRDDRLLVLAAAIYMVSPLDFIPDIIPLFGQTDDLFLVVMALQRLIDNAGRRVLLEHWTGDPRDLSDVNLTTLVSAAGFFLPPGIRKRLRGMVRR
jgi:uncharacterized membrane protein YkvA (DUF1232 family)